MIVAFGELLLRMSSPGRELLLQTPRLDVCVGGAEANVAVGLACLGHATRMASIVPDNALGRAAVGELRRHGVDTSMVATAPGRMGLYFLAPGAGLRASEILYDRTGSAFAIHPGAIDWDVALDGATWLHLSGITPALGLVAAQAALAAANAAKTRGVGVSFDGNYRATLWESWESDPRTTLGALIALTDVLFGNHRDVALLLGRTFAGEGEERRLESASAAFAAFPNLNVIASTARHVDAADSHRLSARVETRERIAQTDEILVSGIVDRIGTGDAFATGVLHELISGGSVDAAARSGLALACLKHSLPGDASLFTQADLAAFHDGGLDVRR